MRHAYYRFIAIAAIIFTTLSMQSCMDKDKEESIVISGEWQGDFGMFYTYVDNRGHSYTFQSYDTRIRFIPDYAYATHGHGTQVDYYEYGPYTYQYYQFDWSIKDGSIYLSYRGNPQLDTRIRRGYHMTNDTFTGQFSETGTRFRLYKIADFYNWTPYYDSYGYGWRDLWWNYYPYYAPGTRGEGEADSTATDSTQSEGHILSWGRR